MTLVGAVQIYFSMAWKQSIFIKPFHYHIKYQAKSTSLESFLCMHLCVGVWELYIHVAAEANLWCCSLELSYNGF